MLRTFNSGLGLVLVVPDEQAEAVVERCRAMELAAWLIGEVAERAPGQEALEIV
jgi:phosphoribosylformylglycinamidine cyclo-ligase